MPGRLTILVQRPVFVGAEQLARLNEAHPRASICFVDTQEELTALLPEADAVLASFPLASGQLAIAPRLRWVQSLGAGVDGLLTPALVAAPLTVTSSKGPMGTTMAEHVVALMLALARDLPAFLRDKERREWHRCYADRAPLLEVGGKTILVIGVGAVGGEVARICKLGLRMRVLGLARTRKDNPHVDAYVERAQLHQAVGEADFVSLSLPLTSSTERIVDAAALAAMKPTAYLLNVGRGRLVDEQALVAALASRQIAGAGLDTFAVEPLPDDHPLWRLPNVVITPHVSATTDLLGAHLVDFWIENIRRFADGQPLLGLVDKREGY